jgi:hypothetical protein
MTDTFPLQAISKSFMDTKPHTLTAEETKEIAAIQDIQDMWGARDADEMTDMLNNAIYAVKFHFCSGCPGYVGDLYILQGDALTGEPPVTLKRDDNGQLALI